MLCTLTPTHSLLCGPFGSSPKRARAFSLPPALKLVRSGCPAVAPRARGLRSLWSPLGRGRGRCRVQHEVPAVPLWEGTGPW